MEKEEFLEKYGSTKVKFANYYKCVFSFIGDLSDITVCVNVGWNADDIYRLEVAADAECTVADLDPFSGTAYENGVAIADFYDY